MNTIVIAIDGSPAAQEAIEFGIELAQEHDAEVVFVHVVPSFDLVPLNGFGVAGARQHETTSFDRALVDDAGAAAKRSGVRARGEILHGNTVDEIVTFADNLDADIIVIGSRGHGRLASALLGSVSKGVLNESKRPVAVIRASGAAPAEHGLAFAH